MVSRTRHEECSDEQLFELESRNGERHGVRRCARHRGDRRRHFSFVSLHQARALVQRNKGVEFLLLIHLICLCLCVSGSLTFMSKLRHLSRPCSEPRHSVIHSVPCLLFLSFVPCPPSSIPSPRHLPPHFTHHSFPATRSALVSLSSLISLWPMAVQVVSVSFPQSGPTA